jgi:hypothetical protein
LKYEDTDMIRLFTDLETLRDVVMMSPIAMDIQKDSKIDYNNLKNTRLLNDSQVR